MLNKKLKMTATVLNILQVIPIVILEIFLFMILTYNKNVALNYIPVRLIVAVEIAIVLWMLIPFFIKKNKVGAIVSIVMSAIMIVMSVGADIAIGLNQKTIKGIFKESEKTIDKIVNNSKLSTDEFGVYILSDDEAKNIEELKDDKFGYIQKFVGDDKDELLNNINEKINQDGNYQEYDDVITMTEALYNKETRAVVLNQSMIDVITSMGEKKNDEADYTDFESKVKCIYTYKVTHQVQNENKKKDITKECFNVYISGIDTFGAVTTKSRSDVNIIMSVNPQTRQILLLSTPRDYYVPLSNSNGVRDKLTHAGLYGVDVSMETLEMLYDIDIDYYVRVNFDGFKDIINALGGIDVDSECAFSAKGYSYSQGINYNMNGDKALVFARERKSFARGDVQRGKNQMSVIKGVISKCASPSILDNYQKILESISESFQTSVSKKNIQKFVKFQLANGYEWNIQSYNVSGSGQSNYTYSVPSNRAYVMVPNEETVAKAKEWLKIVTDGGELKDVTEEN